METDDTEFALFTAKMLIDHGGNPGTKDFEEGWKKYIITQDDFREEAPAKRKRRRI